LESEELINQMKEAYHIRVPEKHQKPGQNINQDVDKQNMKVRKHNM
jgi:hypothetical protein